MKISKIILTIGGKRETQKNNLYELDMTGPCGRRADRCEKYMEYVNRSERKYQTACEMCEESGLD